MIIVIEFVFLQIKCFVKMVMLIGEFLIYVLISEFNVKVMDVMNVEVDMLFERIVRV